MLISARAARSLRTQASGSHSDVAPGVLPPPNRSHVTLARFNNLGQEVARPVSSEMDAGYHEVRIDASSLPSGVYFYRLQAGTFVDTKRLVLLR